ncbi:MAG TPA: hypothetical protein VG759_03290, partial [Candidatus Angelobacter sp.]|nr:hypothetical protein [Candidatus Angelobacter sp.]
HVAFTGASGDIAAEGVLLKKQTGFVKYIRFTDTALKFASGSLRTNFLLAGQQPSADGFPDQVSFRSVAVVRNIDSAPVHVTPKVQYLQNGVVQTVNLRPVALAANETRVIDFIQEQKAGKLPSDFNQGSLELIPDTKHVSIIAELFNFDANTISYVVGSSFSAHPSRATGSIWRIEGSFQTTIMIENTASEKDQVTLKLFSEGGSYTKNFGIPASGLLKINLKELQQNAVPDQDGHLLTDTSGTLSLSGALGIRSKLSFDKLIHSADASEYVGLLANPCNFVTGIGLFFTGMDDPLSFDGEIEADWTDGSQTFNSASSLSSSNSSLATINGNIVTLHPVDASSHTVNFSDEELETSCDICSSDNFFTGGSLTVPPVPTMSCTPSPVTRGQNAQCTINPGVSNGVIYSGWQFTAGNNQVMSNNSSSRWSGTIVQPGTVSANVSIGGRPATTVSANLSVSSRTGFSFNAVSAQGVANNFSGNGCTVSVPNPPAQGGDAVGKFCLAQHASFNAAQIGDGGPNNGYSYVTSITNTDGSGATSYYYTVAPDLQNTGSTFYMAQCGNYNAQTNPNGFISGANLLANTTRHESGAVQSHYQNYVVAQNINGNNVGSSAESFVELTGINAFATDVSNLLSQKSSTILGAAQVEPCSVQQNASCVFQGFINFAPYQACN